MPANDDYFLLLPNRLRERQFLHKIAMIVFLCSLLLCISFFISSQFQAVYSKPSVLSCQTPKYDYNLLSLRWTPTFCASRKCVNSTEDWDIHGLWPSWLNGSHGPQFCCRSWGFSQSEISTLLPQLNEEWPNQMENQSQDSLWKHEWVKHGTCSKLARSGGMVAYFNTTLSLFYKYPLEKWLNEANIKPTPIEERSAYDVAKIHKAIESKLGNKTITVQCIRSPTTKVPLLESIHLCFQPSNMELINCPSDHCRSKKVILPMSQ